MSSLQSYPHTEVGKGKGSSLAPWHTPEIGGIDDLMFLYSSDTAVLSVMSLLTNQMKLMSMFTMRIDRRKSGVKVKRGGHKPRKHLNNSVRNTHLFEPGLIDSRCAAGDDDILRSMTNHPLAE